MNERTYSNIEWDYDSIETIDKDVDGSGTNHISIEGYATCDEGCGHFEFKATASHGYPYENSDVTDIEIEETEFIPNEQEPDDCE